MDRRLFLNQVVGIGGALTMISAASTHALAQQKGVMIAIPLIKSPGSSDVEVLNDARVFAKYISSASGFIDGTLLKANLDSIPFDYLDVTHWESQRNWEDLFSNQEFIDIIEKSNSFTIKAADVFIPVAL